MMLSTGTKVEIKVYQGSFTGLLVVLVFVFVYFFEGGLNFGHACFCDGCSLSSPVTSLAYIMCHKGLAHAAVNDPAVTCLDASSRLKKSVYQRVAAAFVTR